MKRIAIKSKSIPNKPRSDNYPAGSSTSVRSGGGGSTTITPGGSSDIDILKTTDNKSASDKNVFSALRSAAEFISKKYDDSVVGIIDFINGFKIKGKAIEDVARKDDDVELNDKTIPSSTRVLKEIKQRSLSRLYDDTAEGDITFKKEIKVEQLATIARCVVDMISSPTFVDGFTGEGFQIWKSIATGDWNMTVDNLTIRKMFTVFELLVQKIRAVGGMLVVSAADGKIETVERVGDDYVITFASANGFQPNDLIRHQVFTGQEVTYYWTEVKEVTGDKVIIPVSEFEGIIPQVDEECVLMGNTKNPLRQSLITIAATEDGQPRIDVLTGVNKKSFEGNLAVRLGNMDGIKDTYFPGDNQPHGDGLYGRNCYLRGTFLLTTGEDVLTKFTVMENLFRSEMESLRNEIQEKDNYLSNSAFASNTDKWGTTNDVRFFTVNNKLLYFNSNFYSEKKQMADVIDTGSRKVLRIKASGIKQVNADLSDKPDKESSFFVSFRIKVLGKGMVTVGFQGQTLYHTEVLEPTDGFIQKEYSGTWNGTGDFELKFTGDAYLYSLALTDNAISDLYTEFSSKIEQTDKKIEGVVKSVNDLEEKSSGWLTEADGTKIWAVCQFPNGTKALSLFDITPEGIFLSGSHINLSGKVTFDSFSPGFQSSYSKSLNDLDKAAGTAQQTANSAIEAAAAAEVYAKAKAEAERVIAQAYADGIVTQEEQRAIADATAKANAAREAALSSVQSLKNSLGGLAYADLVSLAKLDATVIEGGHIKTSLIDVDTLLAGKVISNKVVTSLAGKRIEIDPGTNSIKMYNNSDQELMDISFIDGNYNAPWIRLCEYNGVVIASQSTIRTDSIEIQTGGATNKVILSPYNGIQFYEAGLLRKSYPNK